MRHGAGAGARATASASATPTLALPKPEAQSKVRARKKRLDLKTMKISRETMFAEDGRCRFPEAGQRIFPCGPAGANDQLAHLDERKRSRTTGREPEFRHDPLHLMRLCPHHHGGYDGWLVAGKTFAIHYLTPLQARGLCRFIDSSGHWLGDN